MFHLGMTRERMRNALTEISDGGPQKTHPPPPAEIDAFNDRELANGIGTPLSDAAARSDHLLSEIADLYVKLGERSIEWNEVKDTTAAVMRNSYTHPRLHIWQYYRENGLSDDARKVFDESVEELRAADAPAFVLGAMVYNLAVVRNEDDRRAEALGLLGEAFTLRPDLKMHAPEDETLGDLREDPRFLEMVGS